MMGYNPLLPGDYYAIFGQVPPRSILTSTPEQPKWNAFGSCVENSCTYVPIQQRYTAFTKYELRLNRGLRAFEKLRTYIETRDWEALARGVSRGSGKDDGREVSAAVDALLKAGLLASAMLVSPNNLREKKECALATFYVNEVSFVLEELARAAKIGDAEAAMAAWRFGRDSWNSYLVVINPSVVPKVGEPFDPVTPLSG